MQRRIVVSKGKKYLVNAPFSEDVGALAPMGTLWMQSITDYKWYAINLTGTSASNDLAIYVNQTPLEWESPGQDFGYQLLYCYDNNNVYQTYLSGSAGSVTMSISQTPWSSNFDYKPYLLLQSLTDGYFYTVSAKSGSIYLFPNPTSRVWLYNTSPPPEVYTYGSFRFDSSTDYLSASASPDFVIGTGDFTVEWYHYQSQRTSPGNQRVFEIKSWPNTTLGVSVENIGFYVWINGAIAINEAVAPVGSWNHYAISRTGTMLRYFRDGTLIASASNSASITNSVDPLTIGIEKDYIGTSTNFDGWISNFHFVNGVSLYTASFTKPSIPIERVSGSTKLLLTANQNNKFGDTSGYNRTIYNNSASWTGSRP